jgi:hypothetical protein
MRCLGSGDGRSHDRHDREGYANDCKRCGQLDQRDAAPLMTSESGEESSHTGRTA